MAQYFIYGLLLQVIIVGVSIVLGNRELIQNLSVGLLMLIFVAGGSGYGWGFFGLGFKQDAAEGKDDYHLHRHKANMRVLVFMLPCVMTLAVYAWNYGISFF